MVRTNRTSVLSISRIRRHHGTQHGPRLKKLYHSIFSRFLELGIRVDIELLRRQYRRCEKGKKKDKGASREHCCCYVGEKDDFVVAATISLHKGCSTAKLLLLYDKHKRTMTVSWSGIIAEMQGRGKGTSIGFERYDLCLARYSLLSTSTVLATSSLDLASELD